MKLIFKVTFPIFDNCEVCLFISCKTKIFKVFMHYSVTELYSPPPPPRGDVTQFTPLCGEPDFKANSSTSRSKRIKFYKDAQALAQKGMRMKMNGVIASFRVVARGLGCSGPWKPESSRLFVGAGCWGNLRRVPGIWNGGDGEGLRKGRLVHE